MRLRGAYCAGLPWRNLTQRPTRNPPAIELLERRCLLSAAAPIHLAAQYQGNGQVVLAAAHQRRALSADSVSLAITSESSRGVVEGALADTFGGSASVAGRLRAARLFLHVADTRTSGDRGSLVLKVSSDGEALTGRFAESHRAGRSSSHWSGSFSLDALAVLPTIPHMPPAPTSAHPPPPPDEPLASGAIDLLGKYTGTAAGSWVFNPDDPGIPDTETVTLSINSQTSDGSVAGTMTGFGSYGNDFVGTLTGNTLAWHSNDVNFATSATLQVYADGSLYGRVNTAFVTEFASKSGAMLLQKLPPPAQIVGTYTGTAQVTDIVGNGGTESAPITLTVTDEAADGSIVAELNAFGMSAALSGAVTGSDLTLTANNVNERVSISATVTSDGRQITGQFDEDILLAPENDWKGVFSAQL